MSTHYFHTIDEAYQIVVRVEEKPSRLQYNDRGRGGRGRGCVGFGRIKTHTKMMMR
jgi:hypothetical protein